MKDCLARNIITLVVCAVVLVLPVILAITLHGDNAEASSIQMFTVVEETPSWKILVDKKTHVMYAVSMGSNNGGTFTMLVNEDGSPRIYK